MSKKTIHITFFFLFLTALTGLLMRYLLLSPGRELLPFSFILHGHSHAALLGWTFLGVFIIFLKISWNELQRKKQALAIIFITLVITICMFIAFLYQGYALYSIIFSMLHIGMEYWMAVFVFRTIKDLSNIPAYSKLFIKGAFISLIISSLGPLSLGGIGMAGMKDSPLFDMAIYFFLHFQYNGWLFLMLIGTFFFILQKQQILLSKRLVTSGFWVYFLSLFPGYVLSILWYDFGSLGIFLAVIGAAGQFAGILLLLSALLLKRTAITNRFSRHIRMSLLFVFMLLVVKAFMEFGLLYQPFAALIFDTRSIIIGYLHLMLLGFITVFILTQYQMIDILDERRPAVLYGLAVFIFGFLINEAVLFLTGLYDWLGHALSFSNDILLFASLLLVAGVLIIWSSTFKKS